VLRSVTPMLLTRKICGAHVRVKGKKTGHLSRKSQNVSPTGSGDPQGDSQGNITDVSCRASLVANGGILRAAGWSTEAKRKMSRRRKAALIGDVLGASTSPQRRKSYLPKPIGRPHKSLAISTIVCARSPSERAAYFKLRAPRQSRDRHAKRRRWRVEARGLEERIESEVAA